MTKVLWRQYVAVVGIVTLGIAAGLPAQTAAPDPWRRVPATPTSCYADHDLATKLSMATQDNLAELNRQEELNLQVKERFAAMDMAEKAQRMQAYMMRNPQEAMRMLQAEQAVGASGLATMEEVTKTAARLDNELADHKKAFDAAVEQAVKPARAKQEALINAKTKPEAQQRAFHEFLTAADQARYVALVAEEDAEYEKACAPYFGAKGLFNRWLETYRSEVIDKTIAAADAGEAVNATQMAIMDTPTGGYRSTARRSGVRDYLRELDKVTGYRRPKATPLLAPKK